VGIVVFFRKKKIEKLNQGNTMFAHLFAGNSALASDHDRGFGRRM
jgi:hypothetical protein